MFNDINLFLILSAHFIASCSPGPATLTIAGTSMSKGRSHGIAIACGITLGSILWSVSAALGLSAIMHSNAWIMEIVRYIGAGYLLYLAYKSAHSAINPSQIQPEIKGVSTHKAAFFKGLMLHITNPKAVLFFGALYSIGLPTGTPISTLFVIIGLLAFQAFILFNGLALLFSSKPMVAGYLKYKRYFETAFALAFGAAAFKVFTSKI
jgi:threonine/homoserine/homoserine lactone efflux protein